MAIKLGNVNWTVVADTLLERANQMPANQGEPAFAATVVLTELARAIHKGVASNVEANIKVLDKAEAV